MPPNSASFAQPNGIDALRDGWADALGQVLADQQREWNRERDLAIAQIRAEIAERLRDVKDGERGDPGRPGERGLPGRPGEPGETGSRGEAGERGPCGEAGERGIEGPEGKQGIQGPPGASGERGERGPEGRLTPVKHWTDAVHYANALVACGGSTWQAVRDTARQPPHDDWICIAAAGRDGKDAPIGEVCGRYDPAREYRRFDLVAHDGGEWRAKKNAPGPLPGPDWALSAVQGKRGGKGEPGERGAPGSNAAHIVEWTISGYQAVPILSDGTAGPVLDLRVVLERFRDELGL